MGATAGLPIEALDFDNPDHAIRRRRWCDAARAEQAGLAARDLVRNVTGTERKILPDRIVDRAFEASQLVVVGVGQVKIEAGGAFDASLCNPFGRVNRNSTPTNHAPTPHSAASRCNGMMSAHIDGAVASRSASLMCLTISRLICSAWVMGSIWPAPGRCLALAPGMIDASR